MMMLYQQVVPVVLASVAYVVASCSPVGADSPALTRELASAVHGSLDALDKALAYFSQHVEEINFDAVIGTRIADGQLSVVLKRYSDDVQRKYPEYREIFRRIWFLQKTASSVSNTAILHLHEKSDLWDLRTLGGIVKPGFWRLDVPPRQVYSASAEGTTSNDAKLEPMGETGSDECISRLLGTRRGSAVQDKKCEVTEHCLELMTTPGYTGFALTHQVFYLAIGIMSGCERTLDARISRGETSGGRRVEQLVTARCAAIYAEADEIAHSGFPDDKHDVFMEQGALCGILGFQDFFTPEWLKEILGWQKPSGCFSNSTAVDSLIPRDGNKIHNIYGSKVHAVVKKWERILRDECLSHRTAVAVGVLSQYVKFLVDAMMGGILVH